jgi:putative (di)nucleoside polyphosphate hydrolase
MLLPYRPAVGIMLLNPQSHVFVGQRLDSTLEAWQMPQGGIDPGETPEQAAWRELGEEVGTNAAQIIAVGKTKLDYDLPADLQGKLWGGRYRGQRQTWFAMRFTGTDADIDIATTEPEFRAWMWVEPARLPDLIVPFKRPLYEAVLNEFAGLLG